MENFKDLLIDPFRKFWTGLVDFLPNLLAMAVIAIGGVLLSWAFRLVLLKAFRALNLDSFCDRMGMTTMLRKANVWTAPSILVANGVFGFFAVVFSMLGLSALRLQAIDSLSVQFFMYLPRAFSALVILVVGYMAAGFVARAVLIAAVNGGYNYAKLLAEGVRLLVIVMVLAMALEQLQIAPGIVVAAFSIIFGGIVVALAVAFGVGGIDAARKVINRGPEEKAGRDKIEHL